MNRLTHLLFFVVLTTTLAPLPALAAAPQNGPLCLPPAFGVIQSDCEALGPYAYWQHLEELGLTLPEQPLPAFAPDLALAQLPYVYAHVQPSGQLVNQRSVAQAPVFATLDDAVEGKLVKRYILPGYDFISYVQREEVGGKKYYLVAPGEWMRGGDLAVGVAYTQFMGREFSATPARKFGWVLQSKEARQAPGANAPLAGRSFIRWDVIQVYDTQEADGLTWYLVGPDAWIDSKDTALVYPTTAPPQGVDNGRWIEVNLFEQTLAVYNDNQLVYATLLSSGVSGFWTRPGLFKITEKVETTPMSGAFEPNKSDYYYLEDVPWTMYFDEARALHGAYWHTKFGYEQSHGCVNLAPGDSKWLYDWASVGDWVYVWDPSGQTPTDPSQYGSGAP